MSFDFSYEHVLENERVILMPLCLNHINNLKTIAKEELIWKYFIGESNGHSRIKEYVKNAILKRSKKHTYAFAIFDKKEKAFAGSTRFFEFSQENKTVRIGYTWIGKEFWGTGLNKNCKHLLLEFAFETIGFERVGLGVHSENILSIAAMKSIGLKQEGVLRNLFPSVDSNGRSNAVLFGIIKEEWFSTIKHSLKNKL